MLTANAEQGLTFFHDAGFVVVVISNQPGVARGFFPERALLAVERRLADMLGQCGVRLAGFYYCPHDPEGFIPEFGRACLCRKPAPGLILQAAYDLGIDLTRSWFIGDILDDIEAGRRAGCRTVLLDRGSETQWQRGPLRTPHHIARDLQKAAHFIQEHSHEPCA